MPCIMACCVRSWFSVFSATPTADARRPTVPDTSSSERWAPVGRTASLLAVAVYLFTFKRFIFFPRFYFRAFICDLGSRICSVLWWPCRIAVCAILNCWWLFFFNCIEMKFKFFRKCQRQVSSFSLFSCTRSMSDICVITISKYISINSFCFQLKCFIKVP